MAVVTHMGIEYPCAKALKGADYVHLVNERGKLIVAFDGVSDFSKFSITGGSWVTPTPVDECYVAVMKDDGTIGKGSHRCSDIKSRLTDMDDVIVCDSLPDSPVEGQWYLVKAEV